jgi:methionyl-tRNA formyltransferase
MQIVFIGSPDFAVPSLNTLAEHFDVVGVITQPDRPSGRGRKLKPSSIKLRAFELELSVFQPKTMKSKESQRLLQELAPSLVVVAAYGQILPQSIINIPQHGIVNVHASLLPRWRGAAPVQAAILNGDPETGVSLMLIDEGMDTGAILAQQSITIQPDETGGALTQRLSQLGAEMLPDTINRHIAGEIDPEPQDSEAATYAPMLKKADGYLQFSKSVEDLARQIRAFEPWPSSFFYLNGLRIVVRKAEAIVRTPIHAPGKTTVVEGFPAVSAADGILILSEVQPAGKRITRGDHFLRGMPTYNQLAAHERAE